MFTSDRVPTLKSVLLASGVVLTLAMGVRHGFGFWMQPISEANGWTRETYSLALALQNLLWGAFGPFAGMAAVDVFESEPILQGHALLRLENCICTPHIGYVEQDSYELYFGAAFDNVVNFIKGTPTNIVNPGSLQVRR
eukprot:gene40400-49964_t